MSRKGLAGAAMASVVLAMVAVAALTSSVGTASPALDSSSDCVALSTLPFNGVSYSVQFESCVEVDGDFSSSDIIISRSPDTIIKIPSDSKIRTIEVRSLVLFPPT